MHLERKASIFQVHTGYSVKSPGILCNPPPRSCPIETDPRCCGEAEGAQLAQGRNRRGRCFTSLSLPSDSAIHHLPFSPPARTICTAAPLIPGAVCQGAPVALDPCPRCHPALNPLLKSRQERLDSPWRLPALTKARSHSKRPLSSFSLQPLNLYPLHQAGTKQTWNAGDILRDSVFTVPHTCL